MTPKSLLRHKLCVSDLSEMAEGTCFHRILDETDKKIADKQVKRVVMCSGKVYYDLLEEREQKQIKDVKIIRLEQIYPFPHKTLVDILSQTPKAELVWCQEEPKNMGSWTFVRDYLESAMQDAGMGAGRAIYAGRKEAASPATGSAARHKHEQEELVSAALASEKQGIAAE